ncbi:blastoderm-specific protein 25D [Dendroctonus ponderosae]|uniref:blastoderm-specific protein 25D n=1 Tax=Dendroctonus ponderosae TaxID=77166 RepID=UPI002035FCA6|nr:blastoderm-specific protein 25D [Dendroctonus ponderosae]
MDLVSRLDPYEQQLLKEFNSHDIDNVGSLDRDGLVQLCLTLQLDDQSSELVHSLLGDHQRRATFAEFKEALLNLLARMQNQKSPTKTPSSPGVEADQECPKYVYGSKKYGRRTRPIYQEEGDGRPVQRSNSQSEVLSKKRKTNFKLKRCTSLPASHAAPQAGRQIECTEETLRQAWSKLGVGADGFLNQTELLLVCDAIGLHKLADEVIKQLELNCDRKISFREVLEVARRDETWTVQADNALFPDSQTFQYVTLGPDGDGFVSADSLIEMWEAIGLHSPKELLVELGFDTRTIRINDLAERLEKQTRTISEAREYAQNPHLVLLQANLALYQSEIRCLRSILDQLRAEREKLKLDVADANNRATLLAQEVDDNHLRMEQTALNQVKLLEQRHADMLRELTAQTGKDKEQLHSLNQALELRIDTLELEAGKLKGDLQIAQQYSMEVEREAQTLNSRIGDLNKDKQQLLERVGVLEADKLQLSELKRQESEMLLAQLTTLQMKTSQLKDRNDEMEAEIETLMTMKGKANCTPTRSFNTLDQSMEEEEEEDEVPSRPAPAGKVDAPFASSESGFDTEPESLSTSTCDPDEVHRLQAKVAFLEQVLAQHNVPVPVFQSGNSGISLSERVRELEQVIEDTKRAISRPVAQQGCQTDVDEVEATVRRLEQENRDLVAKCTELDDCVELLRTEFEKCEDYWQSKVNEERQLFDAEQRVSGDKLNDLLDKMREYEEQYAQQDLLDSRLAPIAETAHLEKQFTDLEQEFEEYKASHEEELFRKEEEISILNGRLSELQLQQTDAEERRVLAKMSTFTSYVIENTSRAPADMQPAAEPSWSTNATSQTPCRPKRMRKHDKTLYQKSGADKEGASKKSPEPTEQNVVLPLCVFNNLIGRGDHLQESVRHLQRCMKQQHYHNEQTLQRFWQQFMGERAELQAKLKYCQEKLDQQMRLCSEHLDKLQRNDLFVKDLYVENAYLFANVERLEKQCRMLAQASNCSSSV